MAAGSFVGIADHRDREAATNKHAGEVVGGLFYPAAILYDAAGNPLTTISATPSGLQNGGLITEVVLNAVTWTSIPTPALVNRNSMGLQNLSAIELKINFATPGGFIGWSIAPGGEFFIDITDAIPLYAKSASGTPTITVMEIS